MRNIKGLTVKQPWAWAIAEGHKRLENRSWKPSEKEMGTWIAIHSSATPPESMEDIQRVAILAGVQPGDEVHQLGAILCVAHLNAVLTIGEANVVNGKSELSLDVVMGQIDHYPSGLLKSDLRWAEGPYCFFFDQVKKIPPIKTKGALSLWRLPDLVNAVISDLVKMP